MRKHRLFIKRMWLRTIEDGTKTIEVRMEDRRTSQIRVGDTIIFSETCERVVVAIRRYPDYLALIDGEDMTRVVPGKEIKSFPRFLDVLYPKGWRGKKALAFELESTA